MFLFSNIFHFGIYGITAALGIQRISTDRISHFFYIETH